MTASAQLDGRIDWYSTFAALIAQNPSSSVLIGTIANTTDQGPVVNTANGWVVQSNVPAANAVNNLVVQRQANIANFMSGAAIAAPNWAASTAYAAGQSVTLPSGPVVTCVTAGTSGASAPAYSQSAPSGRQLSDGSAAWIGVYQTNGVRTQVTAPTVTLYSSFGASGLATQNFLFPSATDPTVNLCSMFGAFANGTGYQGAQGAFTFANGVAAGAGNSTGAAVAAGYSNAYTYVNNQFEVEFYQTDSVVALSWSGVAGQPLAVEVDGVLVQASPTLSAGNVNQTLVLDYAGVIKRRRVRVPGSTGAGTYLIGACTTAYGFIELSDSPNDTILCLGDSIFVATPPLAKFPVLSVAALLSRYLGMTASINIGQGGAGYVSANANTFNLPQLLANPANQTLIKLYNAPHVMVAMGFNDTGLSTSTVAAAALASWQQVRSLLPSAKITVFDNWSEANGPSANAITLSAALFAQFNSWNDTNSRFVQTSGSVASSWMRGTTLASAAVPSTASNSFNFVGADAGVHPTPLGANYLAYRSAKAIQSAWNWAY